ncbi:MAG: nickel pincer cofactor biosynthesis protein LarB [Deltaproteobacteria bacterium]|nr:nickel pincer cofactor biosynthesis protein LarB [Deltaproteobacteria bacterium]
MTPAALAALLADVARGTTSIAEATARLQQLPFADLGFARVDHHRELRSGAPEVIFGAAKTPAQIRDIAASLCDAGADVLVTRAGADTYAAVRAVAADARYHEVARAVTVQRRPPPPLGKIGVLCAGTSDLPVVEEAAVTAEFFGAAVTRLCDVGVAGLHRLLAETETLKSLDVAIVVAGMEGALPSVVGGLLPLPVIAVPTSVGYGASFGGLAALLGMLNSCASGVTVVNIDNGFGAAAAAARILRLHAKDR